MQDKFYFTAEECPHGLREELHGKLDDGEYSDKPDVLNDGILYRVTIEQVGIVRTIKEVEFDSAQPEESN